jgi:hypothetical protein
MLEAFIAVAAYDFLVWGAGGELLSCGPWTNLA